MLAAAHMRHFGMGATGKEELFCPRVDQVAHSFYYFLFFFYLVCVARIFISDDGVAK